MYTITDAYDPEIELATADSPKGSLLAARKMVAEGECELAAVFAGDAERAVATVDSSGAARFSSAEGCVWYKRACWA